MHKLPVTVLSGFLGAFAGGRSKKSAHLLSESLSGIIYRMENALPLDALKQVQPGRGRRNDRRVGDAGGRGPDSRHDRREVQARVRIRARERDSGHGRRNYGPVYIDPDFSR